MKKRQIKLAVQEIKGKAMFYEERLDSVPTGKGPKQAKDGRYYSVKVLHVL